MKCPLRSASCFLLALLAVAHLAPAANIVVNSAADPAGFNAGITVTQAQAAATVTLRDAVNAANNTAGADTISFDAGLAGMTITLSQVGNSSSGINSALLVTTDITINGLSGNSGVTIDGGGTLRVLYVLNGSSLTLNDLTISGGAASDGAGIFSYGALRMNRCTVSGNHATSIGGGVSIANPATTAVLINCTITGNTAQIAAGGIYYNPAANGTMSLANVTITGNATGFASEYGGGIALAKNTALLTNTIIAGNFKANGVPNDVGDQLGGGGQTPSQFDAASSYNLIGTTGRGGLTNGVNGNIIGVADARLAALASNGGPTKTISPIPGSPALNAGLADANVTTDQRGVSRTQYGPPEIGAFEYDLPLPDIAVAQASALTDGVGSVPFGTVILGASSNALTFTITNPSNATLAELALSKDGTNLGDFTVSALSGTSIPVGAGTVTFTVTFTPGGSGARSAGIHIASDVSGAKNPFDITVTGAGNAAPTLTLPASVASPLVVEATSKDGATGTFNVSASDGEDGTLTPNVSPASGSIFPLGDTTVNVSATDTAGATVNGSFKVRVQDTTAPTIGGTFSPLRVAVGTMPDFRSQAVTSDNVMVTSVTQSPGVGTPTAPGVVPVTLTAHDAASHTTSTSFDLVVLPPNPVSTPAIATGATPPGAGTSGGPPSDAKIASFGVPAVDQFGNICYLAKWTSDAQGKGSGLFLNNTCLGIVGGAVDGANGATIKSLADPVIAGGKVACLATLSGAAATAGAVVSTIDGGPLTVIARAGDIPAGADGGKFKSFKAVVMEGNATSGYSVALYAQLATSTGDPKVTGDTDYGIWVRIANQGLLFALREGGQIPGGRKIKTLVSFLVGAGSPGQGRGYLVTPTAGKPRVLALAIFTDKSPGVLMQDLDDVPTITPLSLAGATGDGSPNLANATFARYGVPAFTPSGASAFLASLKVDAASGVTKANASGIFVKPALTGKYTGVVRLGDGGAGGFFSVLKDPVLASDGGLAFAATLKGGTVKPFESATLWWQPPGATLPALLAQSGHIRGNELPSDAQWKAFTSLAIAAGGGPIFAATLVPGKGPITAKNASGVWACDLQGNPRLLFRTGDQDIVSGKTLTGFTLLNATVGTTGATRSFNDVAQVVWLATFSDKSQAIISTAVP